MKKTGRREFRSGQGGEQTIMDFIITHADRILKGEDPRVVEREFRYELGPTFIVVQSDGSLVGTEGVDNAWKALLDFPGVQEAIDKVTVA